MKIITIEEHVLNPAVARASAAATQQLGHPAPAPNVRPAVP